MEVCKNEYITPRSSSRGVTNQSILFQSSCVAYSGHRNLCDVVANGLKWDIEESEFEQQSRYYVHFGMNTFGKYIWRCPWCNCYRRRKWTRWLEFKSWTRLIAFHIALIPLGKVWIQLFSLQLWVNSRTDWVLQPWWGN